MSSDISQSVTRNSNTTSGYVYNREFITQPTHRRDTCFDVLLFRRLFYYIKLCYAHCPMTSLHAFLFVNNIVLHCHKNIWKVRDPKVRNNRFCQCIAVWSNFLQNFSPYQSKILPFIEINDKTSYCVYNPHSVLIWWRNRHVTKFTQNDENPLCCIVHVVYFVYAIMYVFC